MIVIKLYIYMLTIVPVLTVDITVFFNETTYDASDVNGLEAPLLFLSNPSSTNITIRMIIPDLLGMHIVYVLHVQTDLL